MRRVKQLSMISLLILMSGCASGPYSMFMPDSTAFEEAEQAQAQGDLPLAIAKYREAIKYDFSNSRAYVGLGFALLDSNVTEEAMRTFDDAVSKFPDNAAAHRGKGDVYLVIDQTGAAVQEFNKALAICPKDHKTLSSLGVAYDMLGEHEKAQESYRKALELDPTNVSYESNLALSLLLSGHIDDAIRILERLAKSPQSTAKVRQNLSLAYGLSGDMEKATAMGRKDLDDRAIKNNIAYFEAVKSMPVGNGQVSALIPLDQPTRPYDAARNWPE